MLSPFPFHQLHLNKDNAMGFVIDNGYLHFLFKTNSQVTDFPLHISCLEPLEGPSLQRQEPIGTKPT